MSFHTETPQQQANTRWVQVLKTRNQRKHLAFNVGLSGVLFHPAQSPGTVGEEGREAGVLSSFVFLLGYGVYNYEHMDTTHDLNKTGPYDIPL